MSQGMYAASKKWESQGKGFPELPERNEAALLTS